MSSEKPGPAYTRTEWYVRHLSADGVLCPDEAAAGGVEAHRRVEAGHASHPELNPYDLAWQVIADVRDELEVAYREPLPLVPGPLDLDKLAGATSWRPAS